MNYEKVIFLHIAKTGGTSIVEFFRSQLPADSVLSHGEFYTITDNPPLPLTIVENKQFISGHFGYDYIKDYLEDTYTFTLLRDPVRRVLSFYKFCMHEGMQERYDVARAARDLSLADFLSSTLPEVCEILDNQQTWQLASMYRTVDRRSDQFSSDAEVLDLAKSHLEELSFVGFTEAFEESFRRISLDVGWQPPHNVPRQLPTKDPLMAEHLKPEVLAGLRERLQLDYALYDFARAKYSIT